MIERKVQSSEARKNKWLDKSVKSDWDDCNNRVFKNKQVVRGMLIFVLLDGRTPANTCGQGVQYNPFSDTVMGRYLERHAVERIDVYNFVRTMVLDEEGTPKERFPVQLTGGCTWALRRYGTWSCCNSL